MTQNIKKNQNCYTGCFLKKAKQKKENFHKQNRKKENV